MIPIIPNQSIGNFFLNTSFGEVKKHLPSQYTIEKKDSGFQIIKTSNITIWIDDSGSVSQILGGKDFSGSFMGVGIGSSIATLKENTHLYGEESQGNESVLLTKKKDDPVEDFYSSTPHEYLLEDYPGIGFVVKNGKIEAIYVFDDDTAVSYGYIDKAGNIVIAPEFEEAKDFSNGYALVFSDQWQFIDTMGKKLSTQLFKHADSFAEGLAAVCYEDQWGYINTKGEIAIQAIFSEVSCFSNGLARVRKGAQYGFIDQKGEVILPLNLPGQLGLFKEEMAYLKKKERYGFINKKGNFCIAPQFQKVKNFSEGKAAVQLDGKWGYIDKYGKIIIKPKYEEAYDFSEARAAVKFNGLLGFIDPEGNEIIPFQFEAPYKYMELAFSQGLAAIKKNGLWGYIDTNGKPLIPAQFRVRGDTDPTIQGRMSFSEGLAAIPEMNRWGYIDCEGKMLIPPQFFSASQFNNGLALVGVTNR